MLLMQKVDSWIRDRFTFYHVIIVLFQLFGAFVVALASPFLLRQLLLPSLIKYTVPLHFNFKTCREQLAGICSFPTATVDFSEEKPELSPGEYYELSVEIILSESAITSNIGIFQAVVKLVDQMDMKRTFRRSFFANRHHGIMHRIGQSFWNLACKTLFFPAYFFGLLTVLDHRKLEISFTNRLVDSDLANIALLYVQLQNRFIEVESGKLSISIHLDSLRFLLHDFPILFRSSGLFNLNYNVPINEIRRSSVPLEVYTDTTATEDRLQLKEPERSEIEGDETFLIWNDLKRDSNKASESFLHRRQQSKRAEQ